MPTYLCMNRTSLNCQQTASSVVDRCQKSVPFGGKDSVVNHVVKDTMLVILRGPEGDMGSVVVVLVEVAGVVDIQS